MTDPTPHRNHHDDAAPALEPWALELLEQEDAGSDPAARQELSRVVGLLRDLEGPETDPQRVERLIRALEGRRARPRALRVAFGAAHRISRPPVALALAAGVAGLLAITIAPESIPVPNGRGAEPVIQPTQRAGTPAPRPAPVRLRRTPVIRPQLVNVSAFPRPSAAGPLAYDRPVLEYTHDQGLDHQLNQLMIDPDAFARRLERVGFPDRFIARLVERAAERGDAPEIALQVRQSPHPRARQLVDQLLRSTVVASSSRR